ncbi:hypothetical protein TNCV_4675601 [Trichonephila clavipes]|nr:hypothetical protein TNCV_4675601 [Trichonephila clavipes]
MHRCVSVIRVRRQLYPSGLLTRKPLQKFPRHRSNVGMDCSSATKKHRGTMRNGSEPSLVRNLVFILLRMIPASARHTSKHDVVVVWRGISYNALITFGFQQGYFNSPKTR